MGILCCRFRELPPNGWAKRHCAATSVLRPWAPGSRMGVRLLRPGHLSAPAGPDSGLDIRHPTYIRHLTSDSPKRIRYLLDQDGAYRGHAPERGQPVPPTRLHHPRLVPILPARLIQHRLQPPAELHVVAGLALVREETSENQQTPYHPPLLQRMETGIQRGQALRTHQDDDQTIPLSRYPYPNPVDHTGTRPLRTCGEPGAGKLARRVREGDPRETDPEQSGHCARGSIPTGWMVGRPSWATW